MLQGVKNYKAHVLTTVIIVAQFYYLPECLKFSYKI